jgi:hypothetical protein
MFFWNTSSKIIFQRHTVWPSFEAIPNLLCTGIAESLTKKKFDWFETVLPQRQGGLLVKNCNFRGPVRKRVQPWKPHGLGFGSSKGDTISLVGLAIQPFKNWWMSLSDYFAPHAPIPTE